MEEDVNRCIISNREGTVHQETRTIRMSLPYKLSTVNCCLVEVDNGYVLIDTGPSNQRMTLETELKIEGYEAIKQTVHV